MVCHKTFLIVWPIPDVRFLIRNWNVFYVWFIKGISCLLLMMSEDQFLQCSRSFTWYVDWYWYDITMLRSRVSNDLVIMLLMGGYSLKCSLQQRSMDQTTTRISSLTLYIEISLRESTLPSITKIQKIQKIGKTKPRQFHSLSCSPCNYRRFEHCGEQISQRHPF